MTGKISIALVASVALATAIPASAHKTGSETTGTETPDVPSVESCAAFAWTKKTRCGVYDTTKHHWEVRNDCPRAVKVIWADNAFNRPIQRGAESGKPRSQSSSDVRPGKTLRGWVECVDRAELEICIEYVYPPLKEHDVSCNDFRHFLV